MKKYAHKARGPHVAASMRLTPANHKFLHREAAKMGVSANFYINQLLRLDAKKKGK